MSPMDVSMIKGLSLNDVPTVSVKSKRRNVGRIFVTGYDTNLPRDDVESSLRKLFSSCGEITDICIRQRDDNLNSRAVIYIMGEDEDTADKALQLSGSDVGGWKAIVEPFPFPEKAGRSISLYVSGYDTSLSEIDIESALRKHISSCGEVSYVKFSNKFDSAEVFIAGEDAQDKAMELDGSYMGGRKLLVKVISGGIDIVHKRRLCGLLNRGF